MRLKGIYLLAVAASAVVALTFAGSAAAAPDPACGTTLLASFTLTADINCTGYAGPALKIGQAGITINLNGHTITGSDYYAAGPPAVGPFPVIDNATGLSQGYDGVTVEGGTIVVQATSVGSAPAIDNSKGGDGFVVSNMTITGPKGLLDSTGIDPTGSTGIMITGTTMTGFRNDILLENTAGAVVQGNTLTPWDAYGTYHRCAGVKEIDGTNDMVTGNTFTGDTSNATSAPSCYGLYTQNSAGTQFTNNTSTYNYASMESYYGASLTIANNVIGGAALTAGDNNGILLWWDAGDVIQGNYVRNSNLDGIHDYESNNNMYTGNVFTANGNNSMLWTGGGNVSGESNFDVTPYRHGPVTMVNNYSRAAGGYGYRIYAPFNSMADIPTPPYSLITGNAATYNADTGFYISEADGATITHNTAYQNGGATPVGCTPGTDCTGSQGNGFAFREPAQAVITDNTATLNEWEGFYFFGNSFGPFAAASFANNTATYNGDYGFYSDSAVPGSGNSASGNGSGPCYLVAGCS